jgi:predicted nucleotidyltransferase component of viral defense system
MPPDPYLHERSDFADLIRIVADERSLLPALIEKDYWIMHCLYGLAAQSFTFELKGGTSLSKGFGIIQRFSEDIDIRIDPECAPFEVFTGANQTKKTRHIESRQQFYD